MKVLALETSCDDTCASVYDSKNRSVLSNVISSQDDIHDEFQGVVPEIASREHCKAINAVIRSALSKAGVSWDDLDSVAVTYGPGLVGSLLTGIAAAKSISARFELPLIPVNHIEAHIYSIFLEHDPSYPFISLVASGGHTALFRVDGPQHYEVMGHTKDDAVGEAYDKVAKMLDLDYPGGPEIERVAQDGDPDSVDLPRPTLQGKKRWNWHMEGYDFSFSGIKTAVHYHLRDNPDAVSADVAASFQRAVNDVLVYKTLEAAREQEIPRVVLGGGVAANGPLRESFRERAGDRINMFVPSLSFCTDNASMIGYRASLLSDRADLSLNAEPRLSKFTPKKITSEKIVG